ncbi:MAG: gliding motility-associated C-terminal domain-containing protein [Thermonemataceae bacterium]
MKKGLCVLFFSFLTFCLEASHIVGGHFELVHSEGFNYQLSLNLFIDRAPIDQGLADIDAVIEVGIYSRSNHQRLALIALPLVSEAVLPYSNDACAGDGLAIELIRYSTSIVLSEETYREAAGYYVIWERCCRNAAIENIETPEDVGNIFYLAFPPVTRSGERFINSSPTFSNFLGDFACVDRPFELNFGGVDADGDRLAYSLVTPQKGESFFNNPIPPPPAEYPFPPQLVDWSTGFNSTQAFPGEPALGIEANSGRLFMTPTDPGLFVFAIRCEEFRNDIKIGETIIDFQLLVLVCSPFQPPSIQMFLQDGQPYVENDLITLQPDDELCFDLEVNDLDIGDKITLQAISTTEDVLPPTLFPRVEGFIGEDGSASFQLCWDRCFFKEDNSPYIFDVIASDGACPDPNQAILRVQLLPIPAPNQLPIVSATLPGLQGSFLIDELITFEVNALDLDEDSIRLFAVGNGFDLAAVGAVFPEVIGKESVQSTFLWQPDCSLTTSNGQSDTYLIDFIAEDISNCDEQTLLSVTLQVSDVFFSDEGFAPANVFSPNDDGFNDEFYFEQLPPENCLFSFQGITIYNRWGKEVYQSNDKNFRWNGVDIATGVYFYSLDFKGKMYRGTVSLIR